MVEKSTANNKERNGVTLRKKHSLAEILIFWSSFVRGKEYFLNLYNIEAISTSRSFATRFLANSAS